MQKSGIFNYEFMPRKNVPLDSAYVFRLYATYYNALHDFRQGYFSNDTHTSHQIHFPNT